MDYLSLANSNLLFICVSVVLATVLIQAVITIRNGWREAKRLGVSSQTLATIVKNSALITIVPTIPIVITLFLLVPLLGRYIPWLRLSVVGSGPFEMLAAEAGAQAAGASGLVSQGFTKEAFVNAVWCMSIGGSCSLFFSIIGIRPVCKFYEKMKERDSTWLQIMGSVAMMSLLVSFTVDKASLGVQTTIIIAATILFTIGCMWLAKKYNKKQIADFILPISMIFGLAFSYLLCNVIL